MAEIIHPKNGDIIEFPGNRFREYVALTRAEYGTHECFQNAICSDELQKYPDSWRIVKITGITEWKR